jgi:hypothetical protein
MLLRALFRGGFVGGLVAFLATAFSWSVLGWHQAAIHPLADEAASAAFLRRQAPASGVYLLPDPHHPPTGLAPDSLASHWARQVEAARRGPVAFLAVRAQGQDLRNPAWMANTVSIHLLGASLLTLLLWPLRRRSYWRRWSLLMLAVAAGGVLNQLPYWNWWHMGPAWTLTTLADLLCCWGLAGLVIAWAAGAGRAGHGPGHMP